MALNILQYPNKKFKSHKRNRFMTFTKLSRGSRIPAKMIPNIYIFRQIAMSIHLKIAIMNQKMTRISNRYYIIYFAFNKLQNTNILFFRSFFYKEF